MPRRTPPQPPPPPRRSRGSGTVRALGDGKIRAWRARDGNGHRASKTFAGPDAEQRAKTWAQGAVEPAVLLLGHWLDRWLSLRQPTIDPGTYGLYRRAVMVCAPLASRPLADLTTDDWQELTNSLLTRWSRYHVSVWRQTVSGAIAAAIPRHLAHNPLTRVRLPRAMESPPKAWTRAEIDRLLAAAAGHRFEPWLLFALGTGVRLGESRALLWSDVDMVNRTATISASVDNNTNRRGPTKTRKVRAIDVPDEVVAALSAHAKTQRPGTTLVFGTGGQRPVRANTLRYFLRQLCQQAGVPVLPPVSLRHTFASLALDAGVPIQDVARAMGHASIQTTMRSYSHFLGRGLRRTANAMNTVLQSHQQPVALLPRDQRC